LLFFSGKNRNDMGVKKKGQSQKDLIKKIFSQLDQESLKKARKSVRKIRKKGMMFFSSMKILMHL